MCIRSKFFKAGYGCIAGMLALCTVVDACAMHSVAGRQKRAEPDIGLILARQIPAPATGLVAVTNVHLFDGNQITGLQTVILAGEYIGAVIPLANSPVPGATIIDGQGGTLLPGLIDNHCHPTTLADLTSLISYGVTTAIGMACLSYDLCNALKNQTGLTSFISTGLAAIAPGSPHQFLLGTPAQDTISSPAQAPQFVANVFGNHSAFLKLVAEEGGPSQDTLNALVSYAHKGGHIATTHATSVDTYNQALTANTDSIQHVPIEGLLPSSLVQKVIAQKQFVTPTIQAFPYLFAIPGLAPPGTNVSNVIQNAGILYRAGVPILAGTDSFIDPANPIIHIPFGSGLHAEFEYLVQAGVTPLDVLRGATTQAARLHSFHDRGSITPGLRADLTLISGNPLTNISNTRNLKRVWVGGLEYTGALG